MQVFQYDVVDSTNEMAKRLLNEGQIHGLAYVVAESQTAGKGTQGRHWISPPGAGLYLSIIHPSPAYPLPTTATYPLAAGIACAEALKTLADIEIHLKPVNDLYAQNRKLGGILTECLYQEGKIRALITGIGINLRHAPRPLPADHPYEATCLEALLGPEAIQHCSSQTLTAEIIRRLEAWYQPLFQGDRALIIETWQQYQLPGTTLDLAPLN